MAFLNKVVLITGAASGIGEAIALQFAKASARLSLFDINADSLTKVAEKCETISKLTVLKVIVDITIDADLKGGVDSTVKEYGRIDILVNCAGIACSGGVVDSNALDIYDQVININLRAVVALTHFAVYALIESRGCIVNISSVLGRVVHKSGIAYNVSKAGVTHFTKCVALELADRGVRVNCISPSPVKTNIFKLESGMSKEVADKISDNFINCTPLKRAVKAEDIAELVAFLASEKAGSITGVDYAIDSGFAITTALRSRTDNEI